MVPWNYNLVNAFPIPEDRKMPPPPLPTATTIPDQPFRFFDLPPELRNRIYHLVLFTQRPYRQSDNRRIKPCISVFLASRRFHTEASYLLYSRQTFRVFPLQDFNPLPTVRDLPLHYRRLVTTVELVLGPSWTAPPPSWKVTKGMKRCLAAMHAAQTLRVFVEIDPSHPVFAKFRISHGFYTEFSGGLIRDILAAMPKVDVVQIDGRPSVQMDGPLVSRLRQEIEAQGKVIKWGEMGKKEITSQLKQLSLEDHDAKDKAPKVLKVPARILKEPVK